MKNCIGNDMKGEVWKRLKMNCTVKNRNWSDMIRIDREKKRIDMT